MLRFLFRVGGGLALAGAFSQIVVDGARWIAGGSLSLTPLVDLLTAVAPGRIEALGAIPCRTIEEALDGFDLVMMLRIQLERMNAAYFPTESEYSRRWGLDAARLAALPEGSIVMHPGPINRGVEIDSAVADGPHSVILQQVTFGIAVRMAAMSIVAGHEA